MTTQLEQAWEIARERFAAVGIDAEEALRQLDRLPVSMHCWQGDDVAGFENPEGSLTGGIQATGNYPGKARNAAELRADLEQALSLIPGPKRLNLHAIYHEADAPVARNEIKPEHFKNWVAWQKPTNWGSILTPPVFRTRSARMVLPSPTPMMRCASSGLIMLKPAAASLPPSASSSARRR